MDERAKRLLARGRDEYHAGEYDKAEKALAPLARERIPFADVYMMLGVIHYQMGRQRDAVAMFDEALRHNPGYTEAAMHLAIAHNDLGRFDEAKKVYRRMMASRKHTDTDHVDPFVRGKIANMHAEVGQAYEQAGLHAESAHEYRRALALCPTFLDIRTRLGTSLRAAGDLVGAERELQRVKKDNPNLVGPRLQLGMTYYSAGRRSEAAREWREVQAMEPDNRFVKMYLRLLGPENRKRP